MTDPITISRQELKTVVAEAVSEALAQQAEQSKKPNTYTRAQLARALGKDVSTITRWVKDLKLPTAVNGVWTYTALKQAGLRL